jgi:hypothetical protein
VARKYRNLPIPTVKTLFFCCIFFVCSSLVVEIVINGWDGFRQYGDWLRVSGGIVHNSMDDLPFFLRFYWLALRCFCCVVVA